MSELELIPFRRLLDLVLVPARRAFRRVYLPIALPLVAGGAALTIVQVRWTRDLMAAGETADLLASSLMMVTLVVVVMLAYGIGFNALLVASLDAVAGREIDMARAWRTPFRLPILGTLLVTWAASFLSLLMCVVPAFFVVPVLTYVLPVMIEEKRFGWAAIERSFALATDNPTGKLRDSALIQTLALWAAGLLISYALALLVQMPFVVAQQLLVFRDAAAGQAAEPAELMASALWIQLPGQVLSALATAATWLYWTFGISLLFHEIRRRREAADLEAAIGRLTGDQSAGAGGQALGEGALPEGGA